MIDNGGRVAISLFPPPQEDARSHWSEIFQPTLGSQSHLYQLLMNKMRNDHRKGKPFLNYSQMTTAIELEAFCTDFVICRKLDCIILTSEDSYFQRYLLVFRLKDLTLMTRIKHNKTMILFIDLEDEDYLIASACNEHVVMKFNLKYLMTRQNHHSMITNHADSIEINEYIWERGIRNFSGKERFQFFQPMGICVQQKESSYSRYSLVYVSDYGNRRIQILRSDTGQILKSFGKTGSVSLKIQPTIAISICNAKALIVPQANRIQVISLSTERVLCTLNVNTTTFVWTTLTTT